MALVSRRRWMDDDFALRHRDSRWGRDDWMDSFHDWPVDWPRPQDLMGRFRDTSRWQDDWPSHWPTMDAVMPRFTSQLDRMDRNWREDPFWKELYPRWAEPIFKEGIDVHSNIVNDSNRFAVDIDAYQFRPEEIQVKTLDDTLMIEGRHEDVRDRDNFTKMYFVRKYQLPSDVDPSAVQSSIDSRGRLTVEAAKRNLGLTGRERLVPIEGSSKRSTSASPRTRHDSGYSNGYSPRGPESPLGIDTGSVHSSRGREVHIPYNERERERDYQREQFIREMEERPYRGEIPIRQTGVPHSAERRLGDEGAYSESRYFHRSESRTSNVAPVSPHQTTMDNERRAQYTSPRRSSVDGRLFHDDREQTSAGRGVFDKIRDKFEQGFKSHRNESRSSSRQEYRDNGAGYRVETPGSTSFPRRDYERANGNESRAESVRSVRIERKTQY